MKQTNGRQDGHSGRQMLEDMGQVVASLLGTLVSSRGQLREQAKQKIAMAMQHLPVVSRDDYDALHGMLQKARMEQESLKARLDALERKNAKGRAQNGGKNPLNEKLKKSGGKAKNSSTSRNKARGGKR